MQRGKWSDKLEQIESYLEQPTEEMYFDLISGRNNLLLIVDWQDNDEDIVEECADLLGLSDLKAEMRPNQQSIGFAMDIVFDQKRINVPFDADGADRDTTLISLNKILQPEYEMRLCQASMGDDEIEFLVLPTELWGKLQRRYGRDVIDDCFAVIDEESCFFG